MANGKYITPVERKKFFALRAEGYSITAAGRLTGFSDSTANRLEKAAKMKGQPEKLEDGSSSSYRERLITSKMSGPIPYADLRPEAKRALEDFDYFRRRYFGRLSSPWQKEAAMKIVSLVETDDKEYLVLNCPPGVGKTTLIHDVACWMICRNRRISILMGSATQALGERNLMQVRRSLERVIPERADPDHIKRGMAVDAETTMAHDFGRFKPTDKEVWTKTSFIVMQEDDDGAISKKEATITAYGLDSTYIGGRFDASLWDDTQDGKRVRSESLREQTENDWEDVAEARVDPGGMMAVIGQRLGPTDIYRFCLDMVQPLDEEEEEALEMMSDEEIAGLRRSKKYHHIKFKAHYPENCTATSHRRDAPAYPDGCLLDPRRLTWREVSAKMERGSRFAVVYQQEDVAPDDVLVQNDWVYGYGGAPGCVDKDRDLWDIPRGITPGECVVIASADPSPTNYWAIELWVYHKPSEMRFLINLQRRKMEAPDFLDWNMLDKEYTGVMQEWQAESRRRGFPIQYWVVERNGAQRFLLQYDMVKKWIALNNVQIIPHDTARNKADAEMGVGTLRPHYQFGRVRLMGKGDGKVRSMKLIDEVTKYSTTGANGSRTDDCVMAQWFFEWNLPRLYLPITEAEPEWRPSWMAS